MPSAIVIGGGPAGSLSALLLARGGMAVQLFESQRFPRHKVCGECLSAVGIDVLTRAGLAGRFEALRPVRLVRSLVHPIDGPSLDLPLPRPMWGLSRYAMDVCLLAAAAEAGVTIHQPARCERVVDGVPPAVVWRDLRTNRVRTESADWVIVADGKRSLFPTSPPQTGDLGIKAHFDRVAGPRDAVELFAGHGCYGGIAPIEDGRWNAAFSVSASYLKQYRGNVSAAFAAVVDQNAVLGSRLSGARRCGPWLVSPLPRYAPPTDIGRFIIPVGNAASALEPIGGEGMGLALQSTELAIDFMRQGSHHHHLPRTYRRTWRGRRAICRIGAIATASPACGAIATLLEHNRRLTGGAMAIAGKT